MNKIGRRIFYRSSYEIEDKKVNIMLKSFPDWYNCGRYFGEINYEEYGCTELSNNIENEILNNNSWHEFVPFNRGKTDNILVSGYLRNIISLPPEEVWNSLDGLLKYSSVFDSNSVKAILKCTADIVYDYRYQLSLREQGKYFRNTIPRLRKALEEINYIFETEWPNFPNNIILNGMFNEAFEDVLMARGFGEYSDFPIKPSVLFIGMCAFMAIQSEGRFEREACAPAKYAEKDFTLKCLKLYEAANLRKAGRDKYFEYYISSMFKLATGRDGQSTRSGIDYALQERYGKTAEHQSGGTSNAEKTTPKAE